jgi:hypothetical protein
MSLLYVVGNVLMLYNDVQHMLCWVFVLIFVTMCARRKLRLCCCFDE